MGIFGLCATRFPPLTSQGRLKAITFGLRKLTDGLRTLTFWLRGFADGLRTLTFHLRGFANGLRTLTCRLRKDANIARTVAFGLREHTLPQRGATYQPRAEPSAALGWKAVRARSPEGAKQLLAADQRKLRVAPSGLRDLLLSKPRAAAHSRDSRGLALD